MTALEIAERALSFVTDGEAEVYVGTESSGLARYAGSEIHQPTLVDNASVQLRVISGRRSGVATTNRTDDEGLAELARRAADVVANASDDPELVPPAPPVELPDAEGYDEETAALGADGQARLAAAACAEAAGDLKLYGYFTSGACEAAIASTAGLRASQRTTDATCLALAAGEGASGYAIRTAWRAGEIDPADVAREALAKAERTRGAVELEPGRYRAVLEPYALADLLYWFSFDTLNGLGFLEERSFFSGRVGERAFDPKLTIVDDGLDPRGLPRSFDFEGAPKQRTPLVEEGVIRGPVWDRATAARAGRESTGNGLPAGSRAYGAGADEPRALARRGRVDRRARGAGRRRHLRHAAPLPQRGQPARGRDHGDDARRDVPDPRRQGRRAARQPALHGRHARRARRAARPDARDPARQPQRLLRRPLGVRQPRARDRDRELQRHRRRLRTRA